MTVLHRDDNNYMVTTNAPYSQSLLHLPIVICPCKVNRLPMKVCLSVQHLEVLTMHVECPLAPLNIDAIQI